jgi:alkaline phosphatase
MVESDCHTERIRNGLDRVLALDRSVERAAQIAGPDTLILVTADHSYDFRIKGGTKNESLTSDIADSEYGSKLDSVKTKYLRREDDHTGDPVLIAAQGPGASNVRGFLSNTDVFR